MWNVISSLDELLAVSGSNNLRGNAGANENIAGPGPSHPTAINPRFTNQNTSNELSPFPGSTGLWMGFSVRDST